MFCENEWFHTDSKKSVGRRIRAIRETQNLSTKDLGEKVGLDADRIRKYENGVMKPGPEITGQIANALGVKSNALFDSQVFGCIGTMYALFELETNYGLRLVERNNGQIYMGFGNMQDIRYSDMNEYLRMWYDRRKQMEEDYRNASTDEERKKIKDAYNMWEWNFPPAKDEDEYLG